MHVKTDADHGLIRVVETTSAAIHDNQVDLAEEGEVRIEIKGVLEQRRKNTIHP
jgi:hypothetical protein